MDQIRQESGAFWDRARHRARRRQPPIWIRQMAAGYRPRIRCAQGLVSLLESFVSPMIRCGGQSHLKTPAPVVEMMQMHFYYTRGIHSVCTTLCDRKLRRLTVLYTGEIWWRVVFAFRQLSVFLYQAVGVAPRLARKVVSVRSGRSNSIKGRRFCNHA